MAIGDVINNLPGDVMRQRGGGSVMVANVSCDDVRFPPSGITPEWKIFWNKALPFTQPVQVPGIVGIRTVA